MTSSPRRRATSLRYGWRTRTASVRPIRRAPRASSGGAQGSRRQGRRTGGGDRLPEAGVEEFSGSSPSAWERVIAWAERRGKLDAYNVGMHIKTSSVFGYLLARSLAWLRPWRPMSYSCYRESRRASSVGSAWSADAARRDLGLARGLLSARLIKGHWRDPPARQGQLPGHRRRRQSIPAHRRRARAGGGDPQGARGGAGGSGRQGARQEPRQARRAAEASHVKSIL